MHAPLSARTPEPALPRAPRGRDRSITLDHHAGAAGCHRVATVGPQQSSLLHADTAVLSACCNEGSLAVNCGAPRRGPSVGQGVSPGTVARFPSSQPNTSASGEPRSGIAPGCGPDSGGSPGGRDTHSSPRPSCGKPTPRVCH